MNLMFYAICIIIYHILYTIHTDYVIVVETYVPASVKNLKLNIYVNIFQQFQMGVVGPCWGDTHICKSLQIYAVRGHTYYIYIL